MLRQTSLSLVSGFISNLRSNDQASSMFWLIHSDLHELRAVAALEYVSTVVASLDPLTQSTDGQRSCSENMVLLEQDCKKGKLNVRMKRRNGRVRVICEDFHVEQAGIEFVALSPGNAVTNQTLLPKVQFNLQLSEKELADRANVVLPFEHQESGKAVQIYDGRRSLSEGQSDPHSIKSAPTRKLASEETTKGEIHYLRDSDDEPLDSDEDPDDDLDI